nr:hypothetical protein CFP56_04414 [Quercus suber]
MGEKARIALVPEVIFTLSALLTGGSFRLPSIHGMRDRTVACPSSSRSRPDRHTGCTLCSNLTAAGRVKDPRHRRAGEKRR